MAEVVDVLIPCKAFAEGKTRLSSLLDAGARADLCRGLLQNAISAAYALPCRRLAVISADPEVVAFADDRGTLVINDPGRGLNAALQHGRQMLEAGRGADTQLMVLPI